MKLWVDYTNWHGKRDWRHIEPRNGKNFEIRFGEYHAGDPVAIDTRRCWTMIMDVIMPDRAANRTLRVDHIHGFHFGAQPPTQPAEAVDRFMPARAAKQHLAEHERLLRQGNVGMTLEQAKAVGVLDGVVKAVVIDPLMHVLYKTGDADAPDIIKDRNGEVVLSLCRVCGKGEVELDEPCMAPADPKELSNDGDPIKAVNEWWPWCDECGLRHKTNEHVEADKRPAIRAEQRRIDDLAADERRQQKRNDFIHSHTDGR